MIVTYQGGTSFKISQGDLSLSINPQAKTSADVSIFSVPKDALENVSEKSGFVITGPGEYEVKDIFIKGFPGGVYVITFEGIKVCFLGSATTEELDDIDMLFVAPENYKTAVALEPSIIIPMAYDKAMLSQFLKESGGKDATPIEKLVIKKKDLEGKEGEIVVLKEE